MTRYVVKGFTFVDQAFRQKGLAFAHARRKLASDSLDTVRVEAQSPADADGPGVVRDLQTGALWRPVTCWTFHASGDLTQARLG